MRRQLVVEIMGQERNKAVSMTDQLCGIVSF